jgi:hypothetical protein
MSPPTVADGTSSRQTTVAEAAGVQGRSWISADQRIEYSVCSPQFRTNCSADLFMTGRPLTSNQKNVPQHRAAKVTERPVAHEGGWPLSYVRGSVLVAVVRA